MPDGEIKADVSVIDGIVAAAMHEHKSEETLHVAEIMKSCFFAGMADYSAHPMFTDDVNERFAAISSTVVTAERQVDLVAEFEKKGPR